MILTKASRLLAEKASRGEGTLESSKQDLQLILTFAAATNRLPEHERPGRKAET